MRALIRTIGAIVQSTSLGFVALSLCSGLIPALVIIVFVPPLIVLTIGSAFVGNGESVAPDRAVYLAQSATLAIMILSLWLSRVRNKATALTAAAIYIAAGLLFIAVEARTSASLGLWHWPTWGGSGFMACMSFVANIWLAQAGWVMILWFFTATMVLGSALMNLSEMGRSPIEGGSEEDSSRAATASQVSRPKQKLDSLAGMEGVKAQLREFAENFQGYRKRRAKPSAINGLLLSGPPGNGKTVFAEALAGELGFSFLALGVKDLASKWVNETPSKIAEVFADAVAHAPCVLFLDEVDAVGRDRGAMSGGMGANAEDIKAVNALLQEIDKARRQRVVVVAATNFADKLDAALVRPGRFDVKIEIPHPDQEARRGILSTLLQKSGLKASPEAVESAALLWERRSAAFIASTVKRLQATAKRGGQVQLTVEDLKLAGRAAARREGSIPKSGTPLAKLVLPAATRKEADSIVFRLKNWEKLAERGGTPPTGVLLYGPPGTGKTNLVRAIALELGDWHLFDVKVAEMLGDPRTFEKTLAQAMEHRPAIVFLDEADDLLRDRSYSSNATATNEILKAMDGVMGSVPELVFMAATNNPDSIDAAAKRGGRFTEKLFMDLLSGEDLELFARSEMARRTAVRFAPDVTPAWLAASLGPIGPADLVAVLSKAINSTLNDDKPRPVARDAVVEALDAILEREPNPS